MQALTNKRHFVKSPIRKPLANKNFQFVNWNQMRILLTKFSNTYWIFYITVYVKFKIIFMN